MIAQGQAASEGTDAVIALQVSSIQTWFRIHCAKGWLPFSENHAC